MTTSFSLACRGRLLNLRIDGELLVRPTSLDGVRVRGGGPLVSPRPRNDRHAGRPAATVGIAVEGAPRAAGDHAD